VASETGTDRKVKKIKGRNGKLVHEEGQTE
jgi:hypothetical protein